MARGHGRILTSIWDDADFLALDEREQRLYLFLISQPNLNHAGLLDLTLRRWSRKARGLTSAELEKTLQALEAARFIVMDDDTEELLIRSFIRNDGVWKQPKVMGAMVSGAMEISSWRLRSALLAEMDRIPLDELSDEPGARGPSIRQQVSEQIETLRKTFGNPPPDPNGRGYGTPSRPPSGTPSDTPSHPLPDVVSMPVREPVATPCATPSDTPGEAPAEGGPKGSTRGRAATSRAHSPAPAPAPAPYPSPEESAREPERAAVAVAEASRPDGRVSLQGLPDDFALNDGMRVWAQQTYPRVDVDHETQKFVLYFHGEGVRRRNWYAAWQKWMADANQHLIKFGPERGNVITLPSRPSTTDVRVQNALALGRQMQAEHDAAQSTQEAQ